MELSKEPKRRAASQEEQRVMHKMMDAMLNALRESLVDEEVDNHLVYTVISSIVATILFRDMEDEEIDSAIENFMVGLRAHVKIIRSQVHEEE